MSLKVLVPFINEKINNEPEKLIHFMLNYLTEDEYRAIRLRFYFKLKYKEISEDLKFTEKSCEQIIKRALRKIYFSYFLVDISIDSSDQAKYIIKCLNVKLHSFPKKQSQFGSKYY